MTERRNAAGKRMTETATDRLSRMLAMVPWVIANPGRPMQEVADEFSISVEQLEKDLNLLWLCGTPGYSHLELIDADWESGHVWVSNADEIAKPMRLTRDEAVALTAGLQALRATAVEGDETDDVVERTLTKLRVAAGTDATSSLAVQIDSGSQHAAYEPLREALRENRRVHLKYYVETRDETTERDVDPMSVVHLDGSWYLHGWCHRATDVRLFRLDRIESVRVLDVDGTPPPDAVPRDLDGPLFVGTDQDLVVVLDADPDAAWVADYYPNEGVERSAGDSDQPGEVTRVTMRVADPRLVERLVLQLGGALRIVSPVQLARAVADEAERTLAGYPHVTATADAQG